MGGLQFAIPLFSHYSNQNMMSSFENFLNRSYPRFVSTTTTTTAYTPNSGNIHRWLEYTCTCALCKSYPSLRSKERATRSLYEAPMVSCTEIVVFISNPEF